jgi:hypothetical protein
MQVPKLNKIFVHRKCVFLHNNSAIHAGQGFIGLERFSLTKYSECNLDALSRVECVVPRDPLKRNTRRDQMTARRAGDEPDFGGAQCFFTKAKEAIYEAAVRVDVLRLERHANERTGWTRRHRQAAQNQV